MGLSILLQSNSPMSVFPIIQSGYNRQEKHGYLKDCVSLTLQKCVVYPLKDCTAPGFYSRLFLVPKPGKNWRPVIDLSVLNGHMHIPTLKMETAEILSHKNRMARFDRPERCLLSCTDTQRIPASTTVSYRWSNISVQSSHSD